MGNQDNGTTIPLQKDKKTWVDHQANDMQNGQDDMDTDEFTTSVLSNYRNPCGVPWDGVATKGPTL